MKRCMWVPLWRHLEQVGTERWREKQAFQFSNFSYPSGSEWYQHQGIQVLGGFTEPQCGPSVPCVQWLQNPACLGQWQQAVITMGGLEILKTGAYWRVDHQRLIFWVPWVQSGFESGCAASVIKSREFSLNISSSQAVIASNKDALLVIWQSF